MTGLTAGATCPQWERLAQSPGVSGAVRRAGLEQDSILSGAPRVRPRQGAGGAGTAVGRQRKEGDGASTWKLQCGKRPRQSRM